MRSLPPPEMHLGGGQASLPDPTQLHQCVLQGVCATQAQPLRTLPQSRRPKASLFPPEAGAV